MLKRQKGQGLVEFALISPVLLLAILAIIEIALIFQGYLAVQHTAREAARWAITYKPDRGMIDEDTPCDGVVCDPFETDEEYRQRRVEMIKLVAVDEALGLRINDDRLGLDGTAFENFGNEPGFFGVEVWGYPSFNEPKDGWDFERDLRDHPGLPGLPVGVRVTHNVELLDPLFQRIVPAVRVSAQSEMINEGTQAGYGNVAPPDLPPPPPLPPPDWGIEITNTPVPDGTASPTPQDTPEDTATPEPPPTRTPVNTPTVTPPGPFIALSDYQVEPTDVILIDVVQHLPGTYELHLVDDKFIVVDTISDTLVIDESGFRRDIEYTIPEVSRGFYYVETFLETVEARSKAVEVLPPPPDLVVHSIGLPDEMLANREITATVEVGNLSTGSTSGYFDVDLYVDPSYPPVTNRPGTGKQWLEGIGPFETDVVTHVVTLYGSGVHELWAQVDTSDWVPEVQNDKENIFGPITVTIECSELSDRFDGPDLDAKWASVEWDAPVHNQWIDGGTLTIETSGERIGQNADKATYLYQSFTGDFVATLKVNQAPQSDSMARIGLMIRAGPTASSPMVAALKTRDSHPPSHGIQFLVRPSAGEDARELHGTVAIDAPVWLRLERTGNAVSAFYSSDGSDWAGAGSTKLDGLPEAVLIGIAGTSQSSSSPSTANVDDFEVCPFSAITPPDEKPPGLKECVQTIELGNFEASIISPPWERNVDAYHASDRKHSGNFSLEFRASVGDPPAYRHRRPWAYQTVEVPGDVLMGTEGTLSYWQYVVPDPLGETPDPDDHFYLAVRDSAGMTVTADIPLAHGDTDTSSVFEQNVVNVEAHLPGDRFAELAGQEIQLYFYGVHNGVTPGTSFYIDDVRFDICTTQPVPDDVPGTASIGGLIEVLLNARPTKLPGIKVWAFAPGGALYRTKTLHDSTYRFYNLPPDTYTIYAEAWTDGILYSGTVEVTVVANERNYGIDLLLE